MCFLLISSELHLWKRTGYGPTDWPTWQTDGRTGTPSNRYAWTHLKTFKLARCARGHRRRIERRGGFLGRGDREGGHKRRIERRGGFLGRGGREGGNRRSIERKGGFLGRGGREGGHRRRLESREGSYGKGGRERGHRRRVERPG